MTDRFAAALEAAHAQDSLRKERQRVCVVDGGTPLAVYERTGPGEWTMVAMCNQLAPAPAYPKVQRCDLGRWLAEQLS